jgi:C-terminal processing protease CtpA/Prc
MLYRAQTPMTRLCNRPPGHLNLQALKRAAVVGEVTGGGVQLTSTERIDGRFNIRTSYARPLNPITKTDWEGAGVIPDIKVPAAEALDVALKQASQRTAKHG